MSEDVCEFVVQLLDQAHAPGNTVIPASLDLQRRIYPGRGLVTPSMPLPWAHSGEQPKHLRSTRGHRSLAAADVRWIHWTLLQEYRPEPVASEPIVFLSEKMMERTTSRSLILMIWQMGNHKLNSETKRIHFLVFRFPPTDANHRC